MDFTAVIPAAGQGRRAGGYKPLWPLREELVIDRIINTSQTVCNKVRVIGGPNFEELSRHIRAHHPEVVLLYNSMWKESNMFVSILTGLRDTTGPVFIHPSDIPGPGSEVYRTLAAALEKNPHEVLRPTFKGRAGHPILLSEETVQTIQQAPPESNLRAELAVRNKTDIAVNDALILHDFDTKEDFDALLKCLQ
ncbi:MAG: NTP transferase domain-containing protein [Proteobacteria bacterium]|nr:NTP transferase domain-containing protein [Pseudomonadota bacterium]